MALSDAELIIGAAQSAPGLVQQYKQATADEQPVSDFQKALVQKWNDYYSKTGDLDGAKRGFINEAHQNAGGGLSNPAPAPQPSAAPPTMQNLSNPTPAPGLANPAAPPQTMSTPGPTGAPPIPTTIPVREPAPEPDPNAVRKPLIHRDPTPDAVAAFDNAARPLKERNPPLFRQLNNPAPQAPQAPPPDPNALPEMKNQRDFNAFIQVAPQMGAMRNADVAAQSRIDVAQMRGQTQQALEGYRQQGRVQLQQMRADLAAQIEQMRQSGQDTRQAELVQAQLDMAQARLDAAAANQEMLINSREGMAAVANDIRLFSAYAQLYGNLTGSQSRLLAPTGGFVGGQGTAVNNQLNSDLNTLRPQVQQGTQRLGQKYGVIPPQPGQAAPPPQPQVGPQSQSTTVNTQSTTRPRVLVPGSTASRQAAAAPQQPPAPTPQSTTDSGMQAAQGAQLPQVPQQRPTQQRTQQKPQQAQMGAWRQQKHNPNDEVTVVYKGKGKKMKWGALLAMKNVPDGIEVH